MLFHNLDSNHPLALSFSDLSVWCYPCESYIDNRQLHVYKNLAHRHKFGEDMKWSYEDNNQAQRKPNCAADSDDEDDDDDDDEDSTGCSRAFRSQQNSYYIQLNTDSNN